MDKPGKQNRYSMGMQVQMLERDGEPGRHVVQSGHWRNLELGEHERAQ